MRLMNSLQLLISSAALAALVACGGAANGPGPQSAPSSLGLVYTDPVGTDWKLVRNPASTDTHLVLDLVGPTGTKFRGVGFNLKSNGTAAFARLGSAGYIADTGVFKLKSTFENYPVEPVLLAGGLKENGTLLTVGIFQKDRYQPSADVSKSVCQIAIDFDAAKTGPLAPGTAIPLAITKAKAIPRSIGTPADPTDDSLANWTPAINAYASSLVPVQIAVGTLKTK